MRELIGPIAAFRLAVAVTGLPRTRSGKTCRKSIADLAKNKLVKVMHGDDRVRKLSCFLFLDFRYRGRPDHLQTYFVHPAKNRICAYRSGTAIISVAIILIDKML